MRKDELIKLLNGHEWNNVEFKKAQRGVPESAYETVSSFSNTGGDWGFMSRQATGYGWC